MIKAFGIRIDILKKYQLIDLLDREGFSQVVTLNAELIVLYHENDKFKRIVDNSHVTVDGQIPLFCIKLRGIGKEIEKITGYDCIMILSGEASRRELRVFLLGSYKLSNRKAQENLKEIFPGVSVEGYSPPFKPYPFDERTNSDIIRVLKNYRPHILFVAFGSPKQEFWIYDNKEILRDIGIKVAVGVGGAINMIAGVERKAPEIISRMGLESLWRLAQNPKRLRRFLRSFKFFKYCF